MFYLLSKYNEYLILLNDQSLQDQWPIIYKSNYKKEKWDVGLYVIERLNFSYFTYWTFPSLYTSAPLNG